MTDYDVLKAAGHSPAKAAEIILDAKRGDEFSIRYLRMRRTMTRQDTDAMNRLILESQR